MGQKARTIEKIRQLAAENKNCLEIAKELDRVPRYIQNLALEANIPIKRTSKGNVEKIKPFVENMYVSIPDASNLLNVSVYSASHILKRVDGMRAGERIRYWLKKESEAGRSVSEISNLIGRNRFGLGIIARRMKLKLDREYTPLSSEEIKKLKQNLDEEQIEEVDYILTQTTLRKIGEKFGYSRQRAQQKIEGYGLYGNWMSNERAKINFARKKILRTLTARIEQES